MSKKVLIIDRFCDYFCNFAARNVFRQSNMKNDRLYSVGSSQFLSDEQFIRQRMRALTLGDCYITDGITEHGEGYVVVSRKHTGGRISFACYLVDAWCCGVKDTFYRLRQEDFEFDDFINQIDGQPCGYDEAHNWVYGSIAFAEEAGIAPDKSFALAKYFLEEGTDDIPLIEYPFGKDGKHCLVAHSRLEASQEGDRRMGDKSYKSYFEDVVLAESQDLLAEQGLTHQEAMQRMEQYMDHMPRWMFRGHSPSEMQEA